MTAQVIHLVDNDSGATADVLVSLGFNCFSWRPVLDSGPEEMLWAPDNFASGKARPSSGGVPILFPFPGRIAGAAFDFRGNSYRLTEGDGQGNALHGFVFNRPWRVTQAAEAWVEAEFQGSLDAPETLERWPSDYWIRARYELSANQLLLRLEYGACGEKDLPLGLGTHAYFRLPLGPQGAADETLISAPVDREWELQNLLTTGDTFPLADDLTLAEGIALGSRSFDTVYGMGSGGAREFTTRVLDPANRRVLWQRCEADVKCFVVYTPPHREAVCIEPYTCLPNPFALEEQGIATGLQVLEPGETKLSEFVLRVTDSLPT